MEFIGQKASNKALNWLTSKKVEVLLGQSVNLDSESEDGGVYTTSGGEKITADCHFVCVGKPLGSSWLQETILKDSLDKRRQLMVDENLRVRGQKNVFAIGDITDVPVSFPCAYVYMYVHTHTHLVCTLFDSKIMENDNINLAETPVIAHEYNAMNFLFAGDQTRIPCAATCHGSRQEPEASDEGS